MNATQHPSTSSSAGGSTKQGEDGASGRETTRAVTGLAAAELLEQQAALAKEKITLKSAQQLEAEFNNHIGADWNKKEKLEKQRIRKARKEAVRKAELDLYMSEEERTKSMAVTREREAKERERRLAELGEKRAKARQQTATREAKKFEQNQYLKQKEQDVRYLFVVVVVVDGGAARLFFFFFGNFCIVCLLCVSLEIVIRNCSFENFFFFIFFWWPGTRGTTT